MIFEHPPYVSTAFGKLLAQSRRFRAWAHLFCQGLHQAPAWLQDEIGTNCHRLVGPTLNVHEATDATALFVEYDAAERSRKDYWTDQIKKLPDRTFIAKIGAKPALFLRTPTVRQRYTLEADLDLMTERVMLPRVSRDAAIAELDWRKQWIADGGYAKSGTSEPHESVGPLFLDDVPTGEIEGRFRGDLGNIDEGRAIPSGRTTTRGRR